MEKQISYCPKCGYLLSGNAPFCLFCGTPVSGSTAASEAGRPPQPTETGASPCVGHTGAQVFFDPSQITGSVLPVKKKRRWLWCLPVGIAVILIAVFVSYRFLAPPKVIPHDINEIKGCPEFYGVTFGMSVDEASALIEVEHKVRQGIERSAAGLENENGMIFLKEGAAWKLYGIPVESVVCRYDVLEMESVYIFFSRKETSFQQVTDLFCEIYGEPAQLEKDYCIWKGKWTQIEIMDFTDSNTNGREITVRYAVPPSSKFGRLSFDGPAHDPCGFLDHNHVFDRLPEYFVEGLTLEEDYSVEEIVPTVEGYESFTKYTLYPRFDYFGVEAGKTAITFDIGENADAIEIVSYLFLLDEENVCERMEYMKEQLEEIYGEYEGCDYTSILFDEELGFEHYETSFEDMLTMFESGQQGIYTISFRNADGYRPVLSLTIDPKKAYYEGYVSY